MIVVGVLLMIIGFVTGIPLLWTIGIIVAVVGLAFLIAGSFGHAIGGRPHYW